MSASARLHRWDEIALEKITELMSQKIVAGAHQMLAQTYLKQGALVPMHAHPSEQMTYVLQGALRFRVGDEEIIAIAKNRSADDELLRIIGDSRDWTKNYQVRLSLVTNPKTPLVYSLRFLSGLGDRDIRMLAKSKNVSATVSAAAKRIVNSRPSG
jgi:hypothetical protein